MTDRELDEQFQMTVTKDELTVITLGLGAASALFEGNAQMAMVMMLVNYSRLRVKTGKDFEPAFESVLEKVTKLAHFYAENKG